MPRAFLCVLAFALPTVAATGTAAWAKGQGRGAFGALVPLLEGREGSGQ